MAVTRPDRKLSPPSSVAHDQPVTGVEEAADNPVVDGYRQSTELYEITQSADPHKGLGVFATRDIPRGTRIIAVEPTLCTDARNDMLDVYCRFEALPSREQVRVLELHASVEIIKEWYDRLLRSPLLHMTDLDRVVRVIATFETNCIEMKDADGGGGNGLFIETARINHSCTPNAQHSWNASIRRHTVHAVRDICAGEEITFSYVDPIACREDRQQALRPYGFTCTCAACDGPTPSGEASEERRGMMRETARFLVAMRDKAERRSPTLEKAPKPETFLEAARTVIVLMHEEGLEGYALSTLYPIVVKYALILGDRPLAVEMAEKEVELKRTLFGDDHPDTQEARKALSRIERLDVPDSRAIESHGAHGGLEDPFGSHSGFHTRRGGHAAGSVQGSAEIDSESGYSGSEDRGEVMRVELVRAASTRRAEPENL